MPIEPQSPSSTGSSRAAVEVSALDAHPSAPTWMLVTSLGSGMVSLSSKPNTSNPGVVCEVV